MDRPDAHFDAGRLVRLTRSRPDHKWILIATFSAVGAVSPNLALPSRKEKLYGLLIYAW